MILLTLGDIVGRTIHSWGGYRIWEREGRGWGLLFSTKMRCINVSGANSRGGGGANRQLPPS